METQEVNLTAPRIHHTLLGPHGESYSGPLSGSVSVTVASSSIVTSDYPKVSVWLTRTLTSEPRSFATVRRRSGGFFDSLRRRESSPNQRTLISEQSVCSTMRAIAQCDLSQAPSHVERHDDGVKATLTFKFAMPVPSNTPATTVTALGTISYAIAATLTSASGTIVTITEPIRILRRVIPDRSQTVQHVRTFIGEQMILELDITPKVSPDLGGKISYTARLSAKKTITRGPRASELRLVVIKELKWRVEETVKILSISGHGESQDEITCKAQCVRQLCDGSLTGRWSVTGGRSKIEATNDTVHISFDIAIPKDADVVEDLELSAYNVEAGQPCPHRRPYECYACAHGVEEVAAIVTSHQLRLDVIAGEDTIDQATGRLVDRKPVWKSFSAFFRLPVYESASSEEISYTAFLATETLPRYDEGSRPPSYEIVQESSQLH